MKWHLAQIVTRIPLSTSQLHHVWDQLTVWFTTKSESRIVRVFALQSLFDLQLRVASKGAELRPAVQKVSAENIPSINARIRKLHLDQNAI